MLARVKALLIVAVLQVFANAGRAIQLADIETVFVIVLENHNWADFKSNTNAPYLNQVLLPQASYCEQYFNPPTLHPSLPNYLWFEAGTNFGILDDEGPSSNHQPSTNHLTALLDRAGISWRTYQEDIDGLSVPLFDSYGYAVRHNPFVYFDDVTGTNDPGWAYGISHIRPFGELASDLSGMTVARYNFITPNVCHDGHDTCSPQFDTVRQSDDWLADFVPMILGSSAWSNNGVLLITWDEGEDGSSDGPIGMIVLSPLGRGNGYTSHIAYTHSSTLRTLQEIFQVAPWLGAAADAIDLRELFASLIISDGRKLSDGTFQLTLSGLIPGRTNVVQSSPDLMVWSSFHTNVSAATSAVVVDSRPIDSAQRYYRLVQLP
jgi:hypothetical protein